MSYTERKRISKHEARRKGRNQFSIRQNWANDSRPKGNLSEEQIDKKLNEVVKSQSFLSKQYDKFKTCIDNLMIDNTKMRKELEEATIKIIDTEKQVQAAMDAVNDLEQYGRRSMTELSGIPRSAEEIVEYTVIAICGHMDIPRSTIFWCWIYSSHFAEGERKYHCQIYKSQDERSSVLQ